MREREETIRWEPKEKKKEKRKIKKEKKKIKKNKDKMGKLNMWQRRKVGASFPTLEPFGECESKRKKKEIEGKKSDIE